MRVGKVPRGRADGRGGVGVREHHPLASQSFKIGRGISDAHIIGHDEDDVGIVTGYHSSGCAETGHGAVRTKVYFKPKFLLHRNQISCIL